jgi:hypothetical protein
MLKFPGKRPTNLGIREGMRPPTRKTDSSFHAFDESHGRMIQESRPEFPIVRP